MTKRVARGFLVLLAVSALCVTPSPAQGSGSTEEAPENAFVILDRRTGENVATQSAMTATLELIEATLNSRLTLKSVFFPTALPLAGEPQGGLVPSQQRLLAKLARDFQRYRELRPDAYLLLEAHTDRRGGVRYNRALARRRAGRVKSFLVEQGVDGADVQIKLVPDVRNPVKIPNNSRMMDLAHNRRVDLALGTTGQRSTRLYPLDAPDAKVLSSRTVGENR